jgi:hypothetical protein
MGGLGELTIPADIAVSICSNLAFAVTAMIGTCLTIVPSTSKSLINRAQVRPSMTGISRSIRMTQRHPSPDPTRIEMSSRIRALRLHGSPTLSGNQGFEAVFAELAG